MELRVRLCPQCQRFYCDDPQAHREIILPREQMLSYLNQHREAWKKAGYKINSEELQRPLSTSPFLRCSECEWRRGVASLYQGRGRKTPRCYAAGEVALPSEDGNWLDNVMRILED